MKLHVSLSAVLITLVGATVPALAHTGVDVTHGFMQGFLHPIGGLDHTLAMVAVGMLAVHLGGRALWALPATFVLIMTAGGILGINGIGIPYVEAAIATSVVVFGLMLALQSSMPVAATVGLVGLFAVFHGYAHGAEMPASASGIAYALGFMAATAALHGVGIGAGLASLKTGRPISKRAAQISGSAMAVAGLGLLAGWI